MKSHLKVSLFAFAFAALAGCAGGQMRTAQTAPSPTDPADMTPVQRYHAGKALWDEKCSTVAGEKIYRTVEDVEVVLLMKVRHKAGDREWADPLWPGAAFAQEGTDDHYITGFLGYEHAPGIGPTGKLGTVTPSNRGYIAPDRRNSNLPGYRWVDVIDEKDGKRWRYSGSVKVTGQMDTSAIGVKKLLEREPNHDLNVYRWTLDKTPAPDPAPRYGVTFEDHVIPEERILGVASSTVKVIDLKTNELMGELTRYAVRGALSRANPSPWLTAYRCPDHAVGTGAATRKFVDQILVPKKMEN
ncbi:MAG: hypothetical protein IPO13_08025 [Rhodocyclaceae bacterium]|nr:hypothetical protein [Rhodocyclaceae bacterium]